MTAKEFIKRYTPLANRVAVQYHVPTLVILTQSAWESGWGKHAPKYNFFGMTGSYKGKFQLLWTYEYVNGQRVRVQRKFRAYDNPVEAFADYAANLQKNFPAAFQYKKGAPEKFLEEVFKGGYATDPAYLKNTLMIMNTLRKYLI